jgi:hypothetical protein
MHAILQILAPFRYELTWETHSDLKPLIESNWSDKLARHTENDVQQKLSSLSSSLSSWSKDTFGSVKKEIKTLKIELELLHNAL